MANPHSTVRYVEPNSMSSNLILDSYEKIPNLEDYSIALNIEVEVCSRNSNGKDSGNSVIILSWDNKKDKVSFMGGTKIGGYTYSSENGSPTRTSRLDPNGTNKGIYNALTTYYADMYVGDLVDYGTSEMIGIKSVNVEYRKSCVPIINITFTDVRGLSLFQPTELSRYNTLNGINGLNKSNIAQSFFQCFYKMPLPKFRIYIKGFYGEPVSYEVMCDKFDTSFNSSTGSFDCNAHFIGYSYSFMTDVSLDALLCAPYSDYVGRHYWDKKVKNGDFYIFDENGNHMEMPTLYEVKNNIEVALAQADESSEETTIEAEEKSHEYEIDELMGIREAYKNWYETLFPIIQGVYGEKYTFLFKENGDDADYYRIIILTKESSETNKDLSEDFVQYPSSFKELNDNLYSLIEGYNEKGYAHSSLKNVSKDFSSYVKQPLFNNVFYNREEEKLNFGGFDRKCILPKSEIMSIMFNESNIDKTLYAIYNRDGVNQFKQGYVIDVDYSDIKRRINSLRRDANRNEDDKTEERAIRSHNQYMLKLLNWYPTIENFTRIMLAHLETLMEMMYAVADETKGRKAKDLGVSIENFSDVNKNGKDIEIPPFPRVTETITGEDNIKKVEDVWIGDLTKGSGFREVDIVNGLLNAVDEINVLEKQQQQILESIKRVKDEEFSLIKYPLTPFDFFITKNPYGYEQDVSNDPNAFAAKVFMRMYVILALNGFCYEYSNKGWSNTNTEFVKLLGELEAENFHNNVKITNNRLYDLLSGAENAAGITSDNVLEFVKNNTPIFSTKPFPEYNLLLPYKLELNGTKAKGNFIYPIQDVSFSKLNETYNYFYSTNSSDKIQVDNEDIFLKNNDVQKSFKKLLYSTNNSVFNTIHIEDDFKKVERMMESIIDEKEYEGVRKIIGDESFNFNEEIFSSFIVTTPSENKTLDNQVIAFAKKAGGKKNRYRLSYGPLYGGWGMMVSRIIDGKASGITYELTEEEVGSYASEAHEGNIQSFTLTCSFGYHINETKRIELCKYKSLFLNDYVNNTHNDEFFVNIRGINELNEKYVKMMYFVISLGCINHNAVGEEMLKGKTFNYLPRLAVLQMGAILALHYNEDAYPLNRIINASASYHLPVDNIWANNKLVNYISSLSPLAKIAYIKYFFKWADNNYSLVSLLDVKESVFKDNNNKTVIENKHYAHGYLNDSGIIMVFEEDDELIKSLTNNLMGAVLVSNTGIFNEAVKYTDKFNSPIKFDEKIAKVYLDGFLEKLRVLYEKGYTKDENGHIFRTSENPKNATKDMKKELYRYLKLLYDKWIPTNSRSTWNYENFFKYNDANLDGHLFYFIDSYYNKIGNKLLINPLKLSEKLGAAFDNNNGDVSIMMLGFMADIYAQNKCMLLSLQNFLNLAEKDAMENMFKPVSFNEMKMPHKHPDFVVVYPYEPSKNLNIDNAEYDNDGFMLNDEIDTPIAIRSRGGDDGTYYRIPAFGVTYGKQYQSYFKNVKVDMNSPIATQQSILAKHSILRNARSDKNNGVVGQDLYDIYTTQSYTCSVDMIGCAWVQPLMYFVLLNVPMFRGSYMIFKVTHRITPGNMETSFTGTRMSKVSNKFIKDMFIDDGDVGGSGREYGVSTREYQADIDNDCPYKVYPIQESVDVNMTGDKAKDGINIMKKLIELGYKPCAAAGVVGNMAVESYDYKNTKKFFKYDLCTPDNNNDSKGVSGGLCMWRNGNLIALTKKDISMYGVDKTVIEPTQENVNLYSSKLASMNNGLNYQLEFLAGSMSSSAGWSPYKLEDFNKEALSPSVAAANFMLKYERPTIEGLTGKIKTADLNNIEMVYNAIGKQKSRLESAEAINQLYEISLRDKTQKTNADDKKNNESNYNRLFFNAVKKSYESTKASKNRDTIDFNEVTVNNQIKIKSSGEKNDHLGLVFDIILNGYYDNLQELWWGYKNDVSEQNPSVIYVKASPNVKTNERKVGMCQENDEKHENLGQITSGASESLLKSLSKKYYTMLDKICFAEVEQLKNDKSPLEVYNVASCNDIVGNGVKPYDEMMPSNMDNSVWANAVRTMGEWYQNNIHTYQNATPPNKGTKNRRYYNCSLTNSKVGDDCSGFVSACLQYFNILKKGEVHSSTEYTTSVSLGNVLKAAGFTKLDYSWDIVQPYDVISYCGHVEILAEKSDSPKSWGWGSVHDGLDGRAGMPANSYKFPLNIKGDGKGDNLYKVIWRLKS